MSSYILAIDQGTTGTKALLLTEQLDVLSEAYREFPQYFPQPGWVEHDLEEIFVSVRESTREALTRAQIDPKQIAGIGITNQRETTAVWDRTTGEPIHRAIVWQDRRTADLCKKLTREGVEARVREKTGLVIDPYFSGTKIAWLLDNVKGARSDAAAGKLLFGTLDTYLTWRLSGRTAHVTDPSNASRTLLLDLASGSFDDELLTLLNVPPTVLPSIRANDEVFAETQGLDFLPDGIPIAALVGDQQAALFGQVCFEPGDAKCTYGTGAFLVLNTGDKIVRSKRGLLSTIAWKRGGETTYALEGSCFVAGAVVQWLRDGLRFFDSSEEIEDLARTVASSEGVVLVPSFTGLGAPYWDPTAKGLITGLTRGTTRAHIARAALEGIAFQVADVLRAMEKDLGETIRELKVDGGAARNTLLMQFQADLLGREVVRPGFTSTTVLGAGLQAGLTVGVFKSVGDVRKAWKEEDRLRSKMRKREVAGHFERWEKAIRQVRA